MFKMAKFVSTSIGTDGIYKEYHPESRMAFKVDLNTGKGEELFYKKDCMERIDSKNIDDEKLLLELLTKARQKYDEATMIIGGDK